MFRVQGGIDAVREVADRNMDPVAETLYGHLEHYVRALEDDRGEDAFLAAVIAYHLLAEGVVARTAQNLAADQYERLSFRAWPPASGSPRATRPATSASASPTRAGGWMRRPNRREP